MKITRGIYEYSIAEMVLEELSSLNPKSVYKLACRHKAQAEESLARSDSSRAASLEQTKG